ncbi:MAG: EAL domain-containing protein [Bradyrhizobium sp.]|nr:MAG: EAL domain-containing protein [Bradyrhizobium sp.]
MHSLLTHQLARVTDNSGDVDVAALLDMVSQAYTEADLDRRRTDHAAQVMCQEMEQLNTDLYRLAHRDALTDLANRGLFHEVMARQLARAQDEGDSIAVFCIDFDRFKNINDTFGHHAGDLVLKQAAERMRKAARDCDTLARVGGDEFLLLQIAISQPQGAAQLANRLIKELAEPFDIDGHQTYIGGSVGIAVSPADGTNVDELIRNADLALYQAKEAGRGTFRFFEPAMDLRMQERRIVERDLRKALPAGEFELYYQPTVNLASNRISGFEALIRWNHPERGLVAPNIFIPLAEEIGFIVPMGDWIIRQACATAAQWPDDLSVAVNVSAIQFRNPGLAQVIVSALAASGLRPTRLEIEITESALLQDKDTTLAILHQLRALGVRIAMDDFGTGFSSLTYLQCFPFDKIKIDRSFIKDITENAGSLNIVRSIAALAHGIGMTATAEGVETEDQLRSIISEGCTEMQGFLYSRPLPILEIERLFLSKLRVQGIAAHTVAA